MARAYAQLGKVDEALVAIDRALEAVEGAAGLRISPEFLRVKGSLLVEHVESRRIEAQALLRQSLERARRPALLRRNCATMSLVRCDRSAQIDAPCSGVLLEVFPRFRDPGIILARQLLRESEANCPASALRAARFPNTTML
jgi:hypothetical protein